MESQPRVNSKLLSRYIGRHVLLMAEVIDLENQRTTVRASDGGEVIIHLPPGEAFETRYVQLLGKVEDDLSVNVLLSTPAGFEFNMANYNQLVEFANGKYQELFM